MHLLVFPGELLALELILLFVAGGSDFLSGAEDRFQGMLISTLCGLKESATSFFLESAWPVCSHPLYFFCW